MSGILEEFLAHADAGQVRNLLLEVLHRDWEVNPALLSSDLCCPLCGASVNKGLQARHVEWHLRLRA